MAKRQAGNPHSQTREPATTVRHEIAAAAERAETAAATSALILVFLATP